MLIMTPIALAFDPFSENQGTGGMGNWGSKENALSTIP